MYRNKPLSDWWWQPGRKPYPQHAVAIDRTAPMAFGLQSLILLHNIPGGAASGAAAGALYDYAYTNQIFDLGGTYANFTFGVSPYGGWSINETGTGTGSDFIQWQSPLTSTAIWSASSLIKWDGLAHATGGLTYIADHFSATPIQVTQSGHLFTPNGGTNTFGPDITTLSGWTRTTLTSDGTNSTCYINGAKSGSSVAAVATFAMGLLTLDWPWPVADLFYWNRCLDATQVAAHAADPYGTTMRSVMPIRPRVMGKVPFQPYGFQPFITS